MPVRRGAKIQLLLRNPFLCVLLLVLGVANAAAVPQQPAEIPGGSLTPAWVGVDATAEAGWRGVDGTGLKQTNREIILENSDGASRGRMDITLREPGVDLDLGFADYLEVGLSSAHDFDVFLWYQTESAPTLDESRRLVLRPVTATTARNTEVQRYDPGACAALARPAPGFASGSGSRDTKGQAMADCADTPGDRRPE